MQNDNALNGNSRGPLARTADGLRRKSVSAENIYLFKTEVLRALSDETRQGIIVLLGKHKSLCVNDLTAHFNVGRPTVSHHLQVLKEAKVVRSEKQGKEVHYSLNLRNIRRSIKNLDKVLDSIDGSVKVFAPQKPGLNDRSKLRRSLSGVEVTKGVTDEHTGSD